MMSDSDVDEGDYLAQHDSDSDAYSEAPRKQVKSKSVTTTKAKAKTTSTTATTNGTTKAASLKGVPPPPLKRPKAILEERDGNSAASHERPEVIPSITLANMDNEGDDQIGPLVSATKAKSKSKTASETYVKLSQLEHVLKRPDTYIGSVEPITQPMWVYDVEQKGMVYRPTTFVPGLYKIVDEILVNAADNKVRDSTMSTLKVTIDTENKTISVYNDGQGIPVEMHATEGIWIPELIFGQLLTSSNYDDAEAKVTGGRNGYGAKLANIYSTEFIVETACSKNGKKYRQVFTDNMSKKGKPKITENKKGEDWTRISFTPDLARFSMKEFDPDTVSLLQKRVYDMAGITKGVKVYLNDKRIALRDFKAYVEMYTTAANEVTGTSASTSVKKEAGEGVDGEVTVDPLVPADLAPAVVKPTIIYERYGERWEIAFAVSDGQFQQVSFCNSIATTKGGTHVNYIADQIVNGVAELIKKKNKAAPVKPFQIKNHLSVFINCLVANPAFDSQTKENMTLGVKKFGSTCNLSEEFLKKVAKSGVVDNVLNWAKFKQDQMLKKTDGSKRSRITGLVKLEDANNAGTRNGSKCTLILTEGDSAKALAVSGLAVVGRDNFGVFPLRGKLLNVREANGKSLLENAEIQAIKQILGLQQSKVYTSTDSLRYGSLMIMADQDHDGSHIKGLIINFLDYWFPSLLRLPGFLVEFITPIVKVTKAKKEISFFTIPEYEAWKEESGGIGWKIKYFKGLGTSDTNDAKKYFGDMRRHRLPFRISTQEDRDLIDMAFNKKKADNRKEWLRGFVPGTFMDHNVDEVPISDFINKELILFSMADNIRSIPSMVDGFKPGQRKVLFACIKRKLKAEVKVVQLAGYVSEHTAYHHGEQSLQGTIVGLAQNFVGSNNLNFLDPNGQFGTRLQGGKDAASARYIFTNLSKITRKLFHPEDDSVLTYLNDDGQSIEPTWYIPVIPLVLVNGSDGIGTGWSSYIPNYNPLDIIANIKRKMDGHELVPMFPWYRGFRGAIEVADKDGFKCTGLISRVDDSTVEVTELPIRVWTQTFKEQLEAFLIGTEKQPALVKDYKEYHTDTTVHFIITLTEKGKEAVNSEGLEKTFKVVGKVNTGNMVCFDAEGKIKRYSSPEEILLDFYDIRVEYYHKRKAFVVAELSLEHERLSNQARFIQCIITKELNISNRKRSAIVTELRAKEFRPFPRAPKAHVAGDLEEDDDTVDMVDEQGGMDSDFDYLLNMALSSLTAEKVLKLLAERDAKEMALRALLKLSPQDMWLRDLDEVALAWTELLEEDSLAQNRSIRAVNKKGKVTKKRAHSDDSDEEYAVKTKKAAPKPRPKPSASAKDASVALDVAPLVNGTARPLTKPKIDLPSSGDELFLKKMPKTQDKSSATAARLVPVLSKVRETGQTVKPSIKTTNIPLSEDEEDVYTRPTKAPQRSPKAKPGAATATAGKIVKTASAVTAKPKPVKKALIADSEEEEEDQIKSPPKANPRRAAAARKPAYVMDLDSEDAEMDADSDFNESD